MARRDPDEMRNQAAKIRFSGGQRVVADFWEIGADILEALEELLQVERELAETLRRRVRAKPKRGS